MNNSLGVALWRWRKRRSLTQAQLAERLGVRTTSVSNWERGETYPTKRGWEKLEAAGFGVVSVTLAEDLISGQISAVEFLRLLKEDTGWKQ